MSVDFRSNNFSSYRGTGTEVVLQVIDAAGKPGGSSPVYSVAGLLSYTVASPGSRTYQEYSAGPSECLPSPDEDSFTIRTNVTDTLNTCDPWGIRLSGGTPPYTVSFFAPGSPSVTNITTLGNDDAYTYINRAAPDDMLIGELPFSSYPCTSH